MSTVFEASWTELKKAEAEINRLRAALEQIVRECGALNKGPVAVQVAKLALKRD